MTLLEPHRAKLLDCGLTSETWTRAGLHSGSVDEVREILGYGGAGTGLVIPYSGGYARVRIDHPGPDGKRYRSPKAQGNRLYLPPTLETTVLTDPGRPLHLTEGEFKALKLTQEGFPCVALPGVWSWKTNLHGKSLPIADLDHVAWNGRRVVVVFDSDLADKPPVAWAEHELVKELRRRQADVYLLRLPEGPKGVKCGVDDYLVAHGPEAFRRLPMQTPTEVDQDPPAFLRVTDLADAYLLRLLQPHHRITLGYAELDQVVRGVAPGEVMTILGRSAVGKTAFVLNLIDQMTAEGQLPTLMFSLEQQGVEIFERMASLTLGWNGRDLEERARSEDPQVTERLLEVCQRWAHVVLVEKPCTLDQVDQLIESARASDLWPAPLRLVVVDYMGLIGHRKPGTLYEQASLSARALKNFAKRHRVALIVLCQVGREGETGGEPITLKMGRDSGAIEECADYLLGIWRPELREGTDKQERAAVRGEFKVRVLKNRSGPAPKTITLHFEATNLRITPVQTGSVVHGG
jgi:hypothetical protein